MTMDGIRFSIERQKLCHWLEIERRQLALLPADARAGKEAELERLFRDRLDRLYNEARAEVDPATAS
jgi:hypothetical protein